MGDEIFALKMAQRVLELHQLNENVVLRIKPGSSLRRLEVERQPLLNTLHSRSLSQVKKQGKVEAERRGEDRITAKEIDLDLHLVAKPAEDVDVVPSLFVVAAGWIVVDAHRMVDLVV